MNKLKMIFVVRALLLVIIAVNFAQAQHIIEQIDYEIPINFDILPENIDFNDAVDEAKFFLGLSESELNESVEGIYGEIEIIKSTIYIDGENFAVESESEIEGRTTIILDSKAGMIYYVLWSQKQVYEMSKDDMSLMMKETESMVQDMLDQVPPEMRAQVMAVMEAEKGSKNRFGSIESTGKKMTKYGYECDQYMLEGESKVIMIWASEDKRGLAQIVKEVTDKISNIIPAEDEEDIDEWELVAGRIPIEVRTYLMDSMEGPTMTIQAITSIKETSPPADKFVPPGKSNGFTRSSMKELMNQMMEMMEQYGDEEY